MPEICVAHEAEKAERACTERGEKMTQSVMNLWITREDIIAFLNDDYQEPNYHGIIANLKVMTQESTSVICKYLREKLNWLTADERDQRIVTTLFELTNTKTISEFQHLDKKTKELPFSSHPITYFRFLSYSIKTDTKPQVSVSCIVALSGKRKTPSL